MDGYCSGCCSDDYYYLRQELVLSVAFGDDGLDVVYLYGCFLEGMTLIILQSGACMTNSNNNYNDNHSSASSQCHLGGGAIGLLLPVFNTLSTGILFLQWPSSKERAASQRIGGEQPGHNFKTRTDNTSWQV
jgi:hypothetical protein